MSIVDGVECKKTTCNDIQDQIIRVREIRGRKENERIRACKNKNKWRLLSWLYVYIFLIYIRKIDQDKCSVKCYILRVVYSKVTGYFVSLN